MTDVKDQVSIGERMSIVEHKIECLRDMSEALMQADLATLGAFVAETKDLRRRLEKLEKKQKRSKVNE